MQVWVFLIEMQRKIDRRDEYDVTVTANSYYSPGENWFPTGSKAVNNSFHLFFF